MEGTESKPGCDHSFVTQRDSTTENYDRLLTIFPHVIWREVFQVLPNSEDLISVNNASPAFRELLQWRQAEYFFPAVWNIVGSKFLDGFNREILNLRLATRSWKEVIDQSYTVNAFPPDFARIDKKYEKAGKLYTRDRMMHELWEVGDASVIRKFMAHFVATHGNGKSECGPFLSGHVSFLTRNPFYHYPMCDHDPAFESEISRLFQAYGHHIVRCGILFRFGSVTVERASNLRRWIASLPNLISLTFTDFNDIVFPRDRLEQGRNILNELQPLPALEKLERLCLHRIVPAVAQLLMETYNHVFILHLGTDTNTPVFEVSNLSFPNLKCLTISFGSISEFRVLETANFSRAFRKLEITFIDLDNPPVRQIVTMLARKWGTSLEFLKITFYSNATHRHTVNEEIENLKRQYFSGLKEI